MNRRPVPRPARSSRLGSTRKGMKAPGATGAKTSPEGATEANYGIDKCSSISFRNQPAKARELKRGPRRRSPNRSRCSRSRRSTRTSVRSQSRSRFPTVTFNQSWRIQGSDQWRQGQQYEVFRSYHPERLTTRGLVPVALQSREANRWRLLLLEQRLLVSGVGQPILQPSIMLETHGPADLCGSPC